MLRGNPNIQKNPNSQGIHQSGGPGGRQGTGDSGNSSSFANFSEDGTASIAMVATLVRPTNLPSIDDAKVAEMQKACFLR